MPQGDKLFFLTQCFWTILFFSIYFYIMKSYFLPFILEKFFFKLKFLSTVPTQPVSSSSKFPSVDL